MSVELRLESLLEDLKFFKDNDLDVVVLRLHLYRTYQEGFLAGYRDGKDNGWWKEQEQNIDLGGC